MAKPQSPYRSLPAAKRVELVAHVIGSSREARALYVQRLVARGGGFRAATVQGWPAERLAKEIVRFNAEQPQDELDLLHTLYVELEPAVQATFLDAAGVKHENGRIADDAETPYADEERVAKAAKVVREAHGEDGARYLRTLARYTPETWPGIEAAAAAASAPAGEPAS